MKTDKAFIENFIFEANELLDEAEDALLKYDHEKNANITYDTVFRVFYSVKGLSALFGFSEVKMHLHYIEDQLQKSKTDSQHFKDSVDYYLSVIDTTRKMLKGETSNFIHRQ